MGRTMNDRHYATLRCLSTAIASTLLALLVSQPAVFGHDDQTKGQILLEDGFEEGERAPEGWKQGDTVPGVRYAWDRKEASEGSRSLSLRKRAKRYFPIAQWSRTLPHDGDSESLAVSVQVKADGATKAVVDIAFLNDQNGWLSHEWAAYIGAKQAGDPPANHDWREYSGTVKIPEGTRSFLVSLQIYGPGNVWFDDLVVRYGAGDGQGRPTTDGAPVEADENFESIEIDVTDAAVGHYLLAPASAPEPAPADGYGLVIALPGGSGSADFHPFVRRIQEHALDDDYLVAQPLAIKWTPQQVIIWPTNGDRVADMQFTTEEFVAKVIEDVASKQKIDRDRVFLLAWSSSGPAAYATLLQETSPAQGGLIAMSVFKARQLPALDAARDRSFYLLHSRQDRVCPFWMATNAYKSLGAHGASVQLATYEGGHGWHGDVFAMIRDGIDWLETAGK